LSKGNDRSLEGNDRSAPTTAILARRAAVVERLYSDDPSVVVASS
jgi:hypothetical protein